MKRNLLSLLPFLGILLLGACSEEQTADAYGNFEDDALVVSAETAGKLVYYTVEEGKQIKKGELVAVIDTAQFYYQKQVLLSGMKTIDSKAESVESQRAVLEKQLELLLTNQKRIHKMRKDGAATQKQVDDIDSQVEIVKQKIENIQVQRNSVLAEKQSLEAQIGQINDRISKSVIRNPIDGTVLVSYVKQDEFAAPGKPLYSIQDISSLILKAYVSETQLSRIKLNQNVKVEIDVEDGHRELPGTIIWISDKAEFTPKQIQTKEERRNLVYAIKVKVDNKEGMLKIGMPANLNFK